MTEQTMHATITVDRVVELLEDAGSSLSNPGLCLACGEDAEGCEPDAREYTCECCGAPTVYGAQEVLFMVVS